MAKKSHSDAHQSGRESLVGSAIVNLTDANKKGSHV